MRVALYGGSFNPPHLAHQLACAVALAGARPAIDEVWMLPTFRHAFDKPLAPFADRVAMCERAARPFGGRVRVDRLEERITGASYTITTVRALQARDPGIEWVWLMGADLVAERPRWHDWEALRELVSFLIVGRAGVPHQTDDGARDTFVGIDLPGISSTDVRARLAAGEPTHGLVDEAVRAYIDERGLYRPAP